MVAIGNTLNLGGDPSVTSGIVSAKDREISDGTISLDNLIQTDAAINPGNSGGPLVNANGEVVGINTAIIQGAQNIGFSIAIDSVEELIEKLKTGGGDLTPNTPVLGVSTVDVTSPRHPQEFKDQFTITAEEGAIVGSVDPESSAGKAADRDRRRGRRVRWGGRHQLHPAHQAGTGPQARRQGHRRGRTQGEARASPSPSAPEDRRRPSR